MNKKGIETFNIIVMAVIALIVMVVLIYITTTHLGKTSTGLSACESKGGTCVKSKEECAKQNGLPAPFDCKEKTQICCMTIKT